MGYMHIYYGCLSPPSVREWGVHISTHASCAGSVLIVMTHWPYLPMVRGHMYTWCRAASKNVQSLVPGRYFSLDQRLGARLEYTLPHHHTGVCIRPTKVNY